MLKTGEAKNKGVMWSWINQLWQTFASAKPTGLGRKCLPLLPTTRHLGAGLPSTAHSSSKKGSGSLQRYAQEQIRHIGIPIFYENLVSLINPVGKAGSLWLQKMGLTFQNVSASKEPKPSFSRASEVNSELQKMPTPAFFWWGIMWYLSWE